MEAPIVIDIEASGFGRGSYPIEVGFVMPDGTGHCFLLRPLSTWTHWDPEAERVHHIARRDLERSGQPLPDVARQINALLDGRTVYSGEWGVDLAWLAMLFEAAGISQNFRLEDLRALLSDAQAAQWHEVKGAVKSALGFSRQRASAEARVLQLTFLRLTAEDLPVGDHVLQQSLAGQSAVG